MVAMAAILAMTGCRTEPGEGTKEQPGGWDDMQIELRAPHPDAADVTRALKEGWATGDRIVAFFDHDTETYVVLEYDALGDEWHRVNSGETPASVTGSVQALHAGTGDYLDIVDPDGYLQFRGVHGDLHFTEEGIYQIDADQGVVRVTLDMRRHHTTAIKVMGTGDNSRWKLAGDGLAVHTSMNYPATSTLVEGDPAIRFHRIIDQMYALSTAGGLMAEPDQQFAHPEMAVFHVMNTDPGAPSTTFQMIDSTDPDKIYTRTYQRPLSPGATVVIEGPASAIEAESAQWQVTLLNPEPENQFEQNGVYFRRLAPDDPNDLTVEVTNQTYGDLESDGTNSYSGVAIIPLEVTHDGVTYPVVTVAPEAFYQCELLTEIVLPWDAALLPTLPINPLQDGPNHFLNLGERNRITIRVPEGSFAAYVSHPVWGKMANIVEPTQVRFIKVDPIDPGLSIYYRWYRSALYPDRKNASVTRPLPYPYGFTYSGNLTIPAKVEFDGVEYDVAGIAPEAFAENYSMSGVVLPEGITEIGLRAFVDCPWLTSLNIPATTRVVFSGAFEGCSSLSITVAPANGHFASGPNGELTDKAGTKLLWVPESLTAVDYAVPGGTTIIAENSIVNCQFASLTIPASVTKVEHTNFMNCTSLTDITLGWSEEQLASIAILPASYYFDGVDKSAITLHVPSGTEAAYAAHPVWGSGFAAIVEM